MHRPDPERGYALTLMLVLLVAGSLYVIVNRLDASALQAARSAETARALQQAKSALMAYALSYRVTYDYDDRIPRVAGYGYLPCPDLSSDDALASMRGTAAGTCGSESAISTANRWRCASAAGPNARMAVAILLIWSSFGASRRRRYARSLAPSAA